MPRFCFARVMTMAVLAGALMPLAGCMNLTAGYEAKHTVTTQYQAGGIDVLTKNGSIEVITGHGATQVEVEATVHATSQERADKIIASVTRNESGLLVVRVNWPDGKPGMTEGASLVIHLPQADGAKCETDNGSITIANVSGLADLQTSNGGISVADHGGDVKAHTSNGRVEMLGVVGTVDAETSNGTVHVRMAQASKGPAKLSTSNGRIELEVGQSFEGEIAASTSNGHVEMLVPGGKAEKTSGSATLGTGGKKSTLSTSNGNITVTKLMQ